MSGLTTAVRLAEAGHEVTVVSRDRPLATTSAVAAAHVVPVPGAALRPGPGLVAAGLRRLRRRWPASGLSRASGCAGGPSCSTTARREWWAPAVPDLAVTRDVPPGYGRAGASQPRSSTWAGTCPGWPPGPRPPAPQWPTARSRWPTWPLGPVVVDCAGLGARDLAPDPTLTPTGGQVVVVDPVGGRGVGVRRPRRPHAHLRHPPHRRRGGRGHGRGGRVGHLRPDPAVAAAILDRATALVPGAGGRHGPGPQGRPAPGPPLGPPGGRAPRRGDGRPQLRPRRGRGHALVGLRRRSRGVAGGSVDDGLDPAPAPRAGY